MKIRVTAKNYPQEVLRSETPVLVEFFAVWCGKCAMMEDVLDEIAELVSDTDNVERAVDRRELVRAIDTFLERLPADKRRIFVCRYWYFDPVSKIASRFGMTENHVSVTLNRLRLKLHNYLQERGFDL